MAGKLFHLAAHVADKRILKQKLKVIKYEYYKIFKSGF
jgi:hypothetical protein